MSEPTDLLTCKICANEAPLSEMVRERALDSSIGSLTGGVYEVGLMCANCDHWTHSYYTNRQLKQELTLVQYLVAQYQQKRIVAEKMQQARDRYKKNFEQFQQTCNKRLGSEGS